MGVRFAVLGDSERECAEALTVLCRLLGAVPTNLPGQIASDRWIARAVPVALPDGQCLYVVTDQTPGSEGPGS